MRKLLPLIAILVVWAVLAHAQPPDQKALPDGGSIVTSTDGGGPLVTVDTAQLGDWVATLRPRSSCGSPSVHYLFSTNSAPATTADNVLEVDHTFDLPVSQGNTEKYRYLSFLGEDGGAPCVTVYKNAR